MGLWLEKLRKHHYEPDENSEKYDGENDECAVKDDVDDDDYDSCAPVPADDDPVAVQISTNTNKDSEIVDKEDRPHLTERSEEENGNKCSSKLSKSGAPDVFQPKTSADGMHGLRDTSVRQKDAELA
ncbi:hypothetical protein EVAR_79998_1 [Eumeta japonica]|uniref:Uncharacterized protein n=1 Tax=Eumeta variegata TaxID=151549 RepID=A0A4C1ZUR5_EUMVA|nr:hypothetical protein EVAR_79998_1 [Eumeta japonica]